MQFCIGLESLGQIKWRLKNTNKKKQNHMNIKILYECTHPNKSAKHNQLDKPFERFIIYWFNMLAYTIIPTGIKNDLVW